MKCDEKINIKSVLQRYYNLWYWTLKYYISVVSLKLV